MHLAYQDTLQIPTTEEKQFIKITSELEEIVKTLKVKTGELQVWSLHTTLGLFIAEDEEGVLEDLAAMLERLAPDNDDYAHHTSASHKDGEPLNAEAHMRVSLLKPFLSIIIKDGKLKKGQYQDYFVVEQSGPRPGRELFVRVIDYE